MRFSFDMGLKPLVRRKSSSKTSKEKVSGLSPTSVTQDIPLSKSTSTHTHQNGSLALDSNSNANATIHHTMVEKKPERSSRTLLKRKGKSKHSDKTSTSQNDHQQVLAHAKQDQDEHSTSYISISSMSDASMEHDGMGTDMRVVGGEVDPIETYREQLDAMMNSNNKSNILDTSSPLSIIEELHQEEVKRNSKNRNFIKLRKKLAEPSPTSVVKGPSSSDDNSEYNYTPAGYSKLESDPLRQMQTHTEDTYGQREYVIPSFDLPEDAWTIQGVATEVSGTTFSTEGVKSQYTFYTSGTGATRKHKNGVVAMMHKKQKDKYNPRNGKENKGRKFATGMSAPGDDLVNLALVLPHNIDVQQGATQQLKNAHEKAYVKVTKLKGPETERDRSLGLSDYISVVDSTASGDRSRALSHIIDERSHGDDATSRQLAEAGYLQSGEEGQGPLGKLFLNLFQCCNIETVAEEELRQGLESSHSASSDEDDE